MVETFDLEEPVAEAVEAIAEEATAEDTEAVAEAPAEADEQPAAEAVVEEAPAEAVDIVTVSFDASIVDVGGRYVHAAEWGVFRVSAAEADELVARGGVVREG